VKGRGGYGREGKVRERGENVKVRVGEGGRLPPWLWRG